MDEFSFVGEGSPKSSSGVGNRLKRAGKIGGINLLKGVESLFTTVPGWFGVTPPHPVPSELIKKYGNISEEELEPQNIGEHVLKRFAQSAPAAATLGGTQALKGLGYGSTAAGGLGAIGAPEAVQDVAELATQIGHGVYTGKIPTIAKEQAKEYKLAKSFIKKGSTHSADNIQKAVLAVEENLGTEVSEKVSKKVNNILRTIDKNVRGKKLNPSKAVDLRTSINALKKELPDAVNARYIAPLNEALDQYFTSHSLENPTFFKHLKSADQLTALKHMNTITDKFFDKLNVKGKFGAELLTEPIKIALRETERFGRGIASNPAARKYYFNAVEAASANNPSLFMKNMNKVVKLMPWLSKEADKNSFDTLEFM